MILLLVVLKDCLNAALTCHLQHQLSESHWSQVPLLDVGDVYGNATSLQPDRSVSYLHCAGIDQAAACKIEEQHLGNSMHRVAFTSVA